MALRWQGPGPSAYDREMDIFDYLIYGALAAVSIVLALGLFALFRGGDFGRSYSNKLMRLRVLVQAIAIAVLVAAAWYRGQD